MWLWKALKWLLEVVEHVHFSWTVLAAWASSAAVAVAAMIARFPLPVILVFALGAFTLVVLAANACLSFYNAHCGKERIAQDKQSLSLANLCCYLARESKWGREQTFYSDAYYVVVANEIRDNLFQGKIAAYGRPFSPERPIHLMMKAPPRLIESSWWDGKFIDAWRAMSQGSVDSIVYDDPQQRRSGYHEITVARADVETLWPQGPS